jgi:recombination protein RecR
VETCTVCYAEAGQAVCAICSDRTRDPALLCVVADTRDLIAIERTNEYHGLYHVLGGVISPLEGIGPDQLRVRELLRRLEQGTVKEVILATGPQVAGEATALYIQRLLKPLGVRVTNMVYGRPLREDED